MHLDHDRAAGQGNRARRRGMRALATVAFVGWASRLLAACLISNQPPHDPVNPDAGSAQEDVPTVADTGPEDVPQPSEADCRARYCTGRACGAASTSDCGEVTCDACPNDGVCIDNAWCLDRGDTRPRWVVRAVSGTVGQCSTAWDQCNFPFCRPSLPDPFVSLNGLYSRTASDTCNARWDHDFTPPMLEAELRDGVRFFVSDNDSPASNDVICAATQLTFTDADFAAGQKDIRCGIGNTVLFALRPWMAP